MTIVSGGILLAACGGGGSSGGVNSGGSMAPPVAAPAPTPTPAPSPTPPPTPTSSSNSAEYQTSGAVVLAKASAAYDRSITGRGVTIAILDSGIDTAGSEFRGRVSADSTGFDQRIARCATCPAETIRFDVKDVIGHGTRVAGIAAAARDSVGVQGLAPEATILALKTSGANLTGVTPTSGPVPEGEAPNGQLIAPAIRYAVEKGAFVINISANGTAGAHTAVEQRAAMDAVRAADRIVVQSVSNFTDENSFTGQWAENLVGADRANKDWFLFAIGLTETGQPRSANGNAGPLADRMLAAGGVAVRTVDKDGNVVVETGNSFAAPAVSGAAALLKQYWPQLGGRAIARILLDTARDAGASGVDQVYGVGILDIENAMRAQATTASFMAVDAALARFSSLTTSAPFGGSASATTLTGRVSGMTVYDRYGRDFAMIGSSGVRARGSGLLAGGMIAQTDAPWQAARAEAVRFGFAANVGLWASVRPDAPAVVSFSPAAGQRVTFGANVAVGGGAGLAGSQLRGLASVPVGAVSAWSAGGWSASFSSGTSRDGRLHQQVVGFAMPFGLGVELSDLVERGQVLGMRGDATLGLTGARTTLATLIYRRAIASVDLTARATTSSTTASGGSDLLRFAGPLVGSAFSLEGTRGLFGGRATLGLSSPLRVERARAVLSAPVAFDLVSGALTTRAASVDLAPAARELDLELGWSTALSPASSLRLGVAHAFDAGHVAGASDTAGFVTIAIR